MPPFPTFRFVIFLFMLFFSFYPVAAQANYAEGVTAYMSKDWPAALAALKPLADAGDDRAQVMMGHMYTEGRGVVTSHNKAVYYFIKAARQHNIEALLSLGAMYSGGLGVTQNFYFANAWFERAALLGSPQGALLYAMSSFNGDATGKTPLKPDVKKAYKWLRIASLQKAAGQTKIMADNSLRFIAPRLSDNERNAIDNSLAKWRPLRTDELGPFPTKGQIQKEITDLLRAELTETTEKLKRAQKEAEAAAE